MIISTGTASGKSLGYLLPALAGVLEGGTALYIAPTKALAADQLATVRGLGLPGVRAAALDGDTSRGDRDCGPGAYAGYLLTNPDMLHHVLLPQRRRWSRLSAGCEYVIVNQCHSYKGVLGSHVGHVLRRLRRIAARCAPDGQCTFVLASATAGQPGAAAHQLTGLDAEEIVTDGSPHGPVSFAMWEPPLTEARGQAGAPVRRTATAEAAELLAGLVREDVATLAFTRSRRGAESVALQTKRLLAERARPGTRTGWRPTAPGTWPRTGAAWNGPAPRPLGGRHRYRARTGGQHHRPGRGADRGLARHPGVALAAGGPGRAAGQQRGSGADRPGRPAGHLPGAPSGDPAAPGRGHRPRPGDPVRARTAPVRGRVRAALTVADLDLFGPAARPVLDDLCRRSMLRCRPSGWYWTQRARASRLTSLRGSGAEPIRIVEEATGRLVGTVDEPSAHMLAHQGATYLHQGETYLVHSLDLEDGAALVRAGDPGYVTSARQVTDIDVMGVRQRMAWGEAEVCFGDVEVTRQVTSFVRRRTDNGRALGRETPLDLPPRTLCTRAMWWTISADQAERLAMTGVDLPGAAHAAEHASIGLLPLFATCDRWDIGGVSTDLHPATGRLTVFVYDGHEGGAGFAERGYDAAARWLTATRQAIASCECEAGLSLLYPVAEVRERQHAAVQAGGPGPARHAAGRGAGPRRRRPGKRGDPRRGGERGPPNGPALGGRSRTAF